MGEPYTFPVTAGHDRPANVTAAEADALCELYDAVGFFARESERAYDTAGAVLAGIELEQVAGAVIEIRARLERIHRVAATLRERYA